MVKISSTYVGVAGGKLGQGVYYTRKGRTIARQYVAHPFDPQTKKQLNKRQRFALCEEFCQHITAEFKEYWTNELVHQTKFNSLMSYTLNHAAVLMGDVWEMDWSKVRFSSGNLWGIINTGLSNTAGQTIEMTWEDNSGMGYAEEDDEFACMFINLSTYTAIEDKADTTVKIRNTTSKRSDSSCTYDLPAGWAGNEVAVYGCFKSEKKGDVTNTCYFGRISLEIQDPNTKPQIPNSKNQAPSYKVQNEDVKPPGEDEYYTT